MAFLMKDGKGKAVVLYSACADDDHCKAELLMLLEKTPADAKVLGYYDLTPDLTVERFLQSYQGKRREQFNAMLNKVRQGGFRFEEVGIPRLVMGVDQPSPTAEEERQRVADLRATVEHYLPDFARGIPTIADHKNKEESLILHQDAFAAGYHKDEYLLLGLAIKYAGLYGVTVVVHGKNQETF